MLVEFCDLDGASLEVGVWNSAGERIRDLYRGRPPVATNVVLPWDLRNDQAAEVASNVYLVVLRRGRGERVSSAKVAVVRGQP